MCNIFGEETPKGLREKGKIKKKTHHFLQCQQELYGKEESLKSLGNLSLPLCGQDFTQINENLIEEEKKKKRLLYVI